ncbi:MAG: copper resistance protein CopC [candidate division Zixibacteria bacterium]|nr:copper resistance protein CopC [candidate division Zixibacteria bacterium]
MKTFVKYGFGAAFALLLMSAVMQVLSAQTILRNGVPGSNDVLDKTPKRVTLFFTEKIDPAQSSLQVFASDSTRVDDGKPFCSENHKNMGILLRETGPGQYTVRWAIVAEQSGKQTGTYSFQIGKKP